MFWTEEDVQEIYEAAENFLGPNNQYYYGTDSYKNVTVYTADYGKIWFGDVYIGKSKKNFTDNLQRLADKINKSLWWTIGSEETEPFQVNETNQINIKKK